MLKYRDPLELEVYTRIIIKKQVHQEENFMIT
jgi:hypothetical protein